MRWKTFILLCGAHTCIPDSRYRFIRNGQVLYDTIKIFWCVLVVQQSRCMTWCKNCVCARAFVCYAFQCRGFNDLRVYSAFAVYVCVQTFVLTSVAFVTIMHARTVSSKSTWCDIRVTDLHHFDRISSCPSSSSSSSSLTTYKAPLTGAQRRRTIRCRNKKLTITS